MRAQSEGGFVAGIGKGTASEQASADTSRVEAIAREYRLTGYDAAYLELAQRLNLPLATLDKELLLAAPAAGVTLLSQI